MEATEPRLRAVREQEDAVEARMEQLKERVVQLETDRRSAESREHQLVQAEAQIARTRRELESQKKELELDSDKLQQQKQLWAVREKTLDAQRTDTASAVLSVEQREQQLEQRATQLQVVLGGWDLIGCRLRQRWVSNSWRMSGSCRECWQGGSWLSGRRRFCGARYVAGTRRCSCARLFR